MMNMQSKNQYLETIIKQNGYHTKSKKGKSKLLDEYCKNTKQNRKYVIRKIREGKYIQDRTKTRKRARKEYYDGYVKETLIDCWKIFNYPCGQRLKTLLETETDRLIKFKELKCSDKTFRKLKEISFRTIDEKLKHQKEAERFKNKYQKRNNPLLYQKIPVKLSDEWDRSKFGNIQIDLVEHCGQSASGEFINTLSCADISTGWHEGEAIMGRGQIKTCDGLGKARSRFPFNWKEIHSDNGTEFINAHLFRYTIKENLNFSRSRPNKKNDNCFVEQKNWTHVKKFVGYLRYDTSEELEILNDLYRHELRLYKNFFQPVMKLVLKERVKGSIHRRYDKPKTPYQRVIEAKGISNEKKKELKEIYESSNPAELKRAIDKKLDLLYRIYKTKKNKTDKNNLPKVGKNKKLTINSVTFLIAQPEGVLVT